MTEKIETSFNTFIEQTKAALESGAITKPEKIELAKRVLKLAETGSVLDGGFAAFIQLPQKKRQSRLYFSKTAFLASLYPAHCGWTAAVLR